MKETENIKDPNQLDLFAGIVLTVEQQKQVDHYIDSATKSTKFQRNKVQQIEQLLIETGFKVGMDFENTFKSYLETRTVSIGWGNDKFETEITAFFYSGDINLLGVCFNEYDKKIEKRKFGIDISNGKLQTSTTIQGQYRFIKPKTLLEKLKLSNKRSKQQLEEYKKENSLKQIIIEKYTKLYPNATITVKDDWTKYSGTFEVIEIKFASGSYIQFRLDTYKNVEYLYKKHDAEFDNLNSEELLNRFSKQ
jgi:uncharacterized protein YutE (UPF0331/DUF86 family)